MSDSYDIKVISTKIIGSIYDPEHNRLKPFVAAYFPDELLQKMGWTMDTNLKLTVEKDGLKIVCNDDEIQDYYTNELYYVPDEE